MAVVVESSGSQTAIIGTEHSLAAPITAGVRQLVVDMVNLVAGDVVELRVKRMTLAAGVVRTWTVAVFRGPLTDQETIVSIPCPSPHGATFTLKQTAGVARVFPFSVETM